MPPKKVEKIKKKEIQNAKLPTAALKKKASVKKGKSVERSTLGKQVELKQLSQKVIDKYLEEADGATIPELQSGGMKHLYSKLKKGKAPRGKLKSFQNYKVMSAMFSRN